MTIVIVSVVPFVETVLPDAFNRHWLFSRVCVRRLEPGASLNRHRYEAEIACRSCCI